MSHKTKKSRNTLFRMNIVIIVAMLALSGLLVWGAVRNSDALFAKPVYTDVTEALIFRFNLPTTILLICGVAASALMHLYVILTMSHWRIYYRAIEDGDNKAFEHRMARHVNWMRWCIYAISQTLLVVVVARYAGVINLFVLIAIVVLHINLQRSGYLMEVLNAYAEKTETVTFLPFGFGVLSWLAIWGIIFVHYFILASAVSLPIWHHFMIIAATVVNAIFGIFVVSRYMRIAKLWRDNYGVAIAYIIAEIVFAAVVVIPVIVAAFIL